MKLIVGVGARTRRQRQRTDTVSAPLTQIKLPEIDALVCPDLAAFTSNRGQGESQDMADKLDVSVFDNKALFYLRRHNFGFAAPQGCW